MTGIDVFSRSPAPAAAAAAVGPGEALGDQGVADRAAVAQHDAELAAVTVLVAVDRRQLERALDEQRRKAASGAGAELGFAGATRRMGFGRVDVGDADGLAGEDEGVAV